MYFTANCPTVKNPRTIVSIAWPRFPAKWLSHVTQAESHEEAAPECGPARLAQTLAVAPRGRQDWFPHSGPAGGPAPPSPRGAPPWLEIFSEQ